MQIYLADLCTKVVRDITVGDHADGSAYRRVLTGGGRVLEYVIPFGVTVAGSIANRSKFIAGVTGGSAYVFGHALTALTSITRRASNTAVLVVLHSCNTLMLSMLSMRAAGIVLWELYFLQIYFATVIGSPTS